MKKISLFILIILAIPGASTAQCNKDDAYRIKGMINSLANMSEKDGSIFYSWSNNWHALTQPQKERMITLAADSDACIAGKARPIYIYYNGDLVAQASPTTGIKVIK